MILAHLLAVALTGAPATAPASTSTPREKPMWTVTWTTFDILDDGGGAVHLPTSEQVVTLTPNEERVTVTHRDPKDGTSRNEQVHPLAPERRDAIAALLPALDGLSGTYSLSNSAGDEGSHSEELTIAHGTTRVRIQLHAGPGKRPPDAVARLYPLATGHALPPE